jgi:cell wall-associated NlpC family hydrolase
MTEPPGWAARYIGVPFVELGRSILGADCWGLRRLILAERFQLELPDYTGYRGTSRADAAEIRRLLEGARQSGDWLPVPAGQEREGDGIEMVMFDRGVKIPHVATVLRQGLAVHTLEGQASTLLEYRGLAYRRSVLGFHRHRSQAA